MDLLPSPRSETRSPEATRAAPLLALPHRRLFPAPTPLLCWERGAGDADLRVKDDRSIDDVGSGSKLRKLEWLIGDALASGARRVRTFGALGGSHVLAVARQAMAHGLGCELFVSGKPLPAGSFARENARALAELGAGRTGPVRRVTLPLPVRLAVELGSRRRAGERYDIPGGGSSAVGCLGAVDAALELLAQTGEAPDEVVVAAGSCGFAAGLAVGFALAGAPTRVVAVDASSALHPSRFRCARLVRATRALLEAAGRSAPEPSWVLVRRPGAEASRAALELARGLGLALDEIYTAPAFAVLLERARQAPDRRRVFWNTCGRCASGAGAA